MANLINNWLNNTPLAQSLRNWTYNNSGLSESEVSSVPGFRDQMAAVGSTPETRSTGGLLSGFTSAVSDLLDRTQSSISGLVSSAKQARNDVVSDLTAAHGTPVVSLPSDAGTTVPVPDYLNAAIAKAYGMDAGTAYQEALSNTSYQRAVTDLKAAGLNPALISGNFGGASSNVYGASLASNGLSTGVSSAAGAHAWYKQLSNVGGLLGAGAALLTGSGARGAYFGQKVGSATGGAIGNLIDINR